MSASFLFYDLETFGADPRRSRIAQFAAVRTTPALDVMEEPLSFFVQPADDLLPSPIAVYQGKRDRLVNDMLVQGRVDFAAPADYREDGLLETIVFSLLDQLAPQNRMDRIAASQLDEAQAAIIQEDRLAFRDAPD